MIMILPNSSWTKENTGRIDNILRSGDGIVNPSLFFEKYLFWEEENRIPTLDKKIFRRNRQNRPSYDKNYYKKDHFKKIINLKPPLESTQYEQLRNRKNSLPETHTFTLTTKTRLIVNHGVESILENSIALHPYYGFPIIPGSAIKGVTRHYCEDDGLDRDLIIKIFGNFSGDKKAEEGSIVFFDAWPDKDAIKRKLLELDVFTPHYQKYYQNNQLPRDDQSPIPVNFLAVGKLVKFEFAIAPSSKCESDEAQDLINETIEHIENAMSTYGIGAKTGSSYGLL